ncbi:MAG: S8 family serine peptidase [Saprospiraceae bacterium]|nr:S8 family serine peptidase [Saprospiraceae bacterium]MDW8230206.1 S8 family serine peptidase [Saprospiraceae bacterium]
MAKKEVREVTLNYGGQQITLTKSDTEAAVQHTPMHGATPARRSLVGAPLAVEGFDMVRVSENVGQTLDELRRRPEVAVGTHVWNVGDQQGNPLVPTGNLYIEFQPGVDDQRQLAILNELALNIREIVGPGAFRVNVTPASPNPIKCAVALQAMAEIAVAEPEFAAPPMTWNFAVPTGRFIASQWHLENTGGPIPAVDVPNALYDASYFKRGADAKVVEAWKFLGSLGNPNLCIAVIDTGFAADHPQLRGNGQKLRNPLNAAARTTDVSPFVRMSNGSVGVMSHGTSCAAVAAGALDGQGILGAAPTAKLMLIKLDVLTDEAIRNAFEHAMINGADIISCSLGYPTPVPLSTFVSNYLARVAREGRGGRGIPMFFAAGNANPASNNQPREVSDFAAHPDGICVTASNSLDLRSSYSFFGRQAHICAPSNGDGGVGITTATCDLGRDGRSVVLGYTSGFGGTSSAAPLVAGVCALMLTANPDLTVPQIKEILRRSADKIGPANAYDANGHSIYYGFGRVNALRAVQMAAALRQGGSATALTTPTPTPGDTSAAPAQRGRVESRFLNVRSGPGTSFAVLRQLNQGDIVPLFERVSGFWRIGQGEFVSADHIRVLPAIPTAPVAARKGRVNYAFLNVRSGPSTSFSVVGRLNQNDIVDIFETNRDGWHRIGSNRWVLGSYIQIV